MTSKLQMHNDTIVELRRRIVLESKVIDDMLPQIVDLTKADIHMQRVKADECKVVLVLPESRWKSVNSLNFASNTRAIFMHNYNAQYSTSSHT